MKLKGRVGDRVTRRDALDKVLGRAVFADDLRPEGLLYMKVKRSRSPHARLVKIDTTEAQSMPGVVRIFTSKDIPGKNIVGPIPGRMDQEVLAEKKVRSVGDPIALVVAETPEQAEQALAGVKVEYDHLPALLDPFDALHSSTLIHEEFPEGNCFFERKINKGDVDQALAEADVVIDRTYRTSIQEHLYLEPDAGVAWIDEEDRYTVYVSTQNPHSDRDQVVQVLGVPPEKIRVIQAATGGGFGGKLDLSVQAFLLVALYHLRRPVACTYTREEQLLVTPKRHPLVIKYKTGATKEGRLLALDVDVLGDTGAYVSYGMAVATRAAIYSAGPYLVPNARIRSRMVYTNNPIMGAMRTFGVAQAVFAHESQMDILAAELKIDPLEIRLKNALEAGKATVTGQVLQASVGVKDCLSKVWEYGRKSPPPQAQPGKLAGRGAACFIYGIGNTAGGNPSNARVAVDKQGRVALYNGVAELGQGSDTVMPQIVATVLDMDVREIDLVRADTARTKTSGSSSASRQTYISGRAVYEAARDFKRKALSAAAVYTRTDVKELVLEDGRIKKRDGRTLTSLKEMAGEDYFQGEEMSGHGYYDPPVTPLDPETGQGIPYATYAFGCQMADVQVDLATGQLEVLRVVAAQDCGKAINPKNVEEQIKGGVVMGIGYAIYEEFVPGKTKKMRDYVIPSAKEAPEIVPIIVEHPEPTGAFGAKGVGEPTMVATSAAIYNAFNDAVGRRIYQMPATLERVMEILNDRGLREVCLSHV